MPYAPFTQRIIDLIRSIPHGYVCTYGLLAAAGGSPRGARQVSRILHSCARKEGLPWHRVVNRDGKISLAGTAHDVQHALLKAEGVHFSFGGRIDLDQCLWVPPPSSFS